MQKATYYTKHCATSDLIHISFSQVLHRMMYSWCIRLIIFRN